MYSYICIYSHHFKYILEKHKVEKCGRKKQIEAVTMVPNTIILGIRNESISIIMNKKESRIEINIPACKHSLEHLLNIKHHLLHFSLK